MKDIIIWNQIMSDKRNKYETFFSNWLHDFLPDSSNGCIIQDVDFVIQNYHKKKFMLIELKTRWNVVSYPQRKFYNMLHKRLNKSNSTDDWEYVWTHLITFWWDNFYDWIVTLDWKPIWEDELIQFIGTELWF